MDEAYKQLASIKQIQLVRINKNIEQDKCVAASIDFIFSKRIFGKINIRMRTFNTNFE